jgi:hypothetical protein
MDIALLVAASQYLRSSGRNTFDSTLFAGQERQGTIADVVFPTGIDRRDDIGAPDRFDVYYGMADNRIGIARLDLPDFLPQREVVDPPAGPRY